LTPGILIHNNLEIMATVKLRYYFDEFI